MPLRFCFCVSNDIDFARFLSLKASLSPSKFALNWSTYLGGNTCWPVLDNFLLNAGKFDISELSAAIWLSMFVINELGGFDAGNGGSQITTITELGGRLVILSITTEGTLLFCRHPRRRSAALLDVASLPVPMTIPCSPKSWTVWLLMIVQYAFSKIAANLSSVICSLSPETNLIWTLIDGRILKVIANESSSLPRSNGSKNFSHSSSFACCILVSFSCISSCFAANSFVEARSFASPAIFCASPASTIECGSAPISSKRPSIKTTRDVISIRFFKDSSGGKTVGLYGNFLNSTTSSPMTPNNTMTVPVTCSQSQIENDDITDNIYYDVSIWYSSITTSALPSPRCLST